MRITRETGADLLARATVAVLFMLMSLTLLEDFARTRHLTGLLLLVSEAMVVVFTIFRRRTNIVDRSAGAMVVTTLSLLGPPLLRLREQADLEAGEKTVGELRLQPEL